MGEVKKTATETYEAKKNEVGILLDILSQEVKAASDTKTPNWGNAGEMEDIAMKLRGLIKTVIGGSRGRGWNEGEVDRLLNEMIEDSCN